jgi:hypothetical protein
LEGSWRPSSSTRYVWWRILIWTSDGRTSDGRTAHGNGTPRPKCFVDYRLGLYFLLAVWRRRLRRRLRRWLRWRRYSTKCLPRPSITLRLKLSQESIRPRPTLPPRIFLIVLVDWMGLLTMRVLAGDYMAPAPYDMLPPPPMQGGFQVFPETAMPCHIALEPAAGRPIRLS